MGGTCGAGRLGWLHRRRPLERRVHRGAGGGRLRARVGRVHARGRRRHARRNREGSEDVGAGAEGPARGRARRRRRLLLMAVEAPSITTAELRPEHWPDVARIYADGIRSGDATFETAVPEWEQWDRS